MLFVTQGYYKVIHGMYVFSAVTTKTGISDIFIDVYMFECPPFSFILGN